MNVSGINNVCYNQSFGTKVYVNREALNAIKQSPKNARSKIYKHIKDLKNNGVDDILLLRHEKYPGRNDALVADIYANGLAKDKFVITSGWSAKDYIVDPHTYGNKNSYISIKKLYQNLVEDLAYSRIFTDKSSCMPFIRKQMKL